jgi:outer membrane protein assembly factor BamB
MGVASCGSCGDKAEPGGFADAAPFETGPIPEGGGFTPGPALDAGVLAVVCGASSGNDLAAPWPGVRGCSTNAARTRYIGPRRAQLNVVTYQGPLITIAAVSATNVGFGSSDTGAVAVDLTTGAVITEQHPQAFGGNCVVTPIVGACLGSGAAMGPDQLLLFDPDGRHPRSLTPPPNIANGAALAAGVNGDLYLTRRRQGAVAITSDGGVRWSFDAGLDLADDPPATNVAGDTLYFATYPDGVLFALDTQTGALRWQLAERVTSAILVAPDDRVYARVNPPDGGPVVLRAHAPDGGTIFDLPIPDAVNDSPPAYALALGVSGELGSGYVIVLSWGMALRAVRPDGTIAWANDAPDGGWFIDTIVDGEGVIYARMGPDDSGVRAVRPDGTTLWEAGSPTTGPLVIGADGALYGMGGGLVRFAQ